MELIEIKDKDGIKSKVVELGVLYNYINYIEVKNAYDINMSLADIKMMVMQGLGMVKPAKTEKAEQEPPLPPGDKSV